MTGPIECYNKINGCKNTVPPDSESVAFCSEKCKNEYNGGEKVRKEHVYGKRFRIEDGSMMGRLREMAAEKKRDNMSESLKSFQKGLDVDA